MENLKIAWRNLWRNKKRTLITVASLFFGVIIATLMTSMQEGSYSSMVDNVVKFYSGYLQVQSDEYWENKTINNTFELTEELLQKISGTEKITHVAPRLESFALASTENESRGTILFGINPEKEEEITGISKWISSGEMLKSGDGGLLVASGLATYLQLELHDTLVLLGQGYHGVSAAGKYPIRGIVDLPAPDLNRQMVYMELGACQEFYSADNLLTSLIVMVKDPYDLPHARRSLKKIVRKPYRLMSWDEMQPELKQMIEADRAGGTIMKGILYMIIGFGILGTITMMLAERRREMGVMVAIGLQKARLGIILFYETIFIGIVGVISGFLGSIPVISYFINNPVALTGDAAGAMIDMGIEPYMYFTWHPSVFYNQMITVFVITFLIGIIPVVTSFRLELSKALKG
ncbi:MAG: FtsX-like permease family protein [Bacteroidota bacterium]|nr:FtsX-like permease family protein [Bacteroidota bacterium]